MYDMSVVNLIIACFIMLSVGTEQHVTNATVSTNDILNSTELSTSTLSENNETVFLQCPLLTVSPGEFIIYENNTAYVSKHNQSYEPQNYTLHNETLYVCSDMIINSLDETKDLSFNYSMEFIQCPKFGLGPEEYTLNENKTVFVSVYNRLYSPQDYFLHNTTLYLCIPMVIHEKETSQKTETQHLAYIYLTYIGLGISILCLILHLLVFIIVPIVRTLSGYCIASLSFALLMAYFCFISLAGTTPHTCAATGQIMYYFFMASFFWMNTIAFDVFRSLYLKIWSLKRGNGYGQNWLVFGAYSLYSWCSPMAFVMFAVIADKYDFLPEEYKPKFGRNNSCWFGQSKSLTVFFVIPLLVIMIINVLYFLASVAFIQWKNNYSKRATLRHNLAVYVKLAMVMGLGWIFGIVAGYKNIEALWYLFIIVNTLQGLFIFLSFSLTKKVRNYLAKHVFVKCSSTNSYNVQSVPTVSVDITCIEDDFYKSDPKVTLSQVYTYPK